MQEEYYQENSMDNEIVVINEVYQAMKELPDKDAMVRVLEWVCNKLYIRAKFELSKKERLLREGREICGYLPTTPTKRWTESSVDNDWEEEEVEEVADFDTPTESASDSTEEKST